MNYHKENEIENIAAEITFCQKYKKMSFVCIAEFQKPGFHDLTEQNTYYMDGLVAAQNNWQRIYQCFFIMPNYLFPIITIPHFLNFFSGNFIV